MSLIILFAFFSSVLSDAADPSFPDMKPVALSSRCSLPNVNDPCKSPVILLHGITQSKDTWLGIYEDIAIKTERMVCILDARNHGYSAWSDVFNFEVLVMDVNHFMEINNIPKAIFLGHSMGGITAMKLALAKPGKVEKLIIEDISPRSLSNELVNGLLFVLKTMKESVRAIPFGSDLKSAKFVVRDYIKSRMPPGQEDDIMTDEETENLPIIFENGVYRWLTNFDAIIKAFEKPDTLIKPFSGQYDGDSLFIYGMNSPFKVFDDKDAILKYFPKAQLHAVHGASHVIHGRYPEFLAAVVRHINGY